MATGSGPPVQQGRPLLVNPPKSTKADKRHLEDIVEAINESYVEGKPIARVLGLITLRRWDIQAQYSGRLYKAKYRAKKAEARVKELEATARDQGIERNLNT